MKRPVSVFSLYLAGVVFLAACSSQSLNRSVVESAEVASAEIESASVHGDSGARSVESRWMQPMVGARDEGLGAEVEGIETQADSKGHAVRISLPRKTPEIEEVIVYGRIKKDEVRRPILQPTKVEVLSSPEQNGIVIYLPELQDFVLRINYYEAPPDVVPNLLYD